MITSGAHFTNDNLLELLKWDKVDGLIYTFNSASDEMKRSTNRI